MIYELAACEPYQELLSCRYFACYKDLLVSDGCRHLVTHPTTVPRSDRLHLRLVDSIFDISHLTPIFLLVTNINEIMASKEFNVIAILHPKKGKTDEVFPLSTLHNHLD